MECWRERAREKGLGEGETAEATFIRSTQWREWEGGEGKLGEGSGGEGRGRGYHVRHHCSPQTGLGWEECGKREGVGGKGGEGERVPCLPAVLLTDWAGTGLGGV